MQDFLFEWLSGAGAEAAVFASAFISSTLMPGGSEALLAGALSQMTRPASVVSCFLQRQAIRSAR